MPTRATPGSAAYDIYAAGPTTVPARGQALVDTDLAMELPRHVYGQMKSRSGPTTRNRVTVQAGTIDQDYRGRVILVMVNDSDQNFPVRQGDRIAQMVLELHVTPQVQQVTELDGTTRGEAGFGSTGFSGQPPGVQKDQNTPPDSPPTSPKPDGLSGYHAPHTNLEHIFSVVLRCFYWLCVEKGEKGLGLGESNGSSVCRTPEAVTPNVAHTVPPLPRLEDMAMAFMCLISSLQRRGDSQYFPQTEGVYPPVPEQNSQVLVPRTVASSPESRSLVAAKHAECAERLLHAVLSDDVVPEFTAMDAGSRGQTESGGWDRECSRIPYAPDEFKGKCGFPRVETNAALVDPYESILRQVCHFKVLDLWADPEGFAGTVYNVQRVTAGQSWLRRKCDSAAKTDSMHLRLLRESSVRQDGSVLPVLKQARRLNCECYDRR